MDHWLSMIKDVGFPIAVSFYLLVRIEKKLETINQSVRELPKAMETRSVPIAPVRSGAMVYSQPNKGYTDSK